VRKSKRDKEGIKYKRKPINKRKKENRRMGNRIELMMKLENNKRRCRIM
jgi:hypothetical protein